MQILLKCAKERVKNNRGQSTIEAAFILPLLFLALLLLIQPGIIMYDRMIMRNAAAEGCRVLASTPSGQTAMCESYVLRRLSSVPEQSLFHEHGTDCSWEISLEGDESKEEVSVEIVNKIKPLPLIGTAAALLGMLDDRGLMKISVREECVVQPSWAGDSRLHEGVSAWVGTWSDE